MLTAGYWTERDIRHEHSRVERSRRARILLLVLRAHRRGERTLGLRAVVSVLMHDKGCWAVDDSWQRRKRWVRWLGIRDGGRLLLRTVGEARRLLFLEVTRRQQRRLKPICCRLRLLSLTSLE
jgi:hypothetical protein